MVLGDRNRVIEPQLLVYRADSLCLSDTPSSLAKPLSNGRCTANRHRATRTITTPSTSRTSRHFPAPNSTQRHVLVGTELAVAV